MVEPARVDAQAAATPGSELPWRRIAGVLLLLVLGSCFAVIYAAHESRERFRTLEQARRRENDIQVEWRQLLLERSTQSAHARVEAIAGSELQLHPIDGEVRTVVIE